MKASILITALVALGLTTASVAAPVRVEEVPASQLLHELNTGKITSEALVRAYLDRIAHIDRAGPKLRSVLSLNPDAVSQAKQLDAERKAGHVRGPLHGLPILIKDNIESKDRLPTTAGSLALKDNLTGRDAPFIARLRATGAIILGKTNMSEWANERDYHSISSWSGIGGLTRNPYILNRSACGSSGGAGASTAASLAAVGIGTETDGSVTCPASMEGLVGLKPTVGLVSRTYVIPITHSQDTPGPLGRNVRDVALLFSSMIGSDPTDPSTKDADKYQKDYAATLTPDALKGVRLGVVHPTEVPPLVAERFNAALARLKTAGAELIDVELPEAPRMREAELKVFEYEFKHDINLYLASTPAAVQTRSLSAVIAFNKAHADRELGLFGQDAMETAEKLGDLNSMGYLTVRSKSLSMAKDAGIDIVLKAHNVVALVAPSFPPAPVIDTTGINNGFISYGTPYMPAIAGYPHLSVPMGLVRGLPVGLSFIGPAFTDGDLLRYGYAFEATGPLREPPHYHPEPQVGDLLEHVAP